MATIRLCDWTKKRIGKDDPTFVVVVDGQEYEVGEAGRDQLLAQLEGEDEPSPKNEAPVEASAPPPVEPAEVEAVVEAEIEEVSATEVAAEAPTQDNEEVLEIPEDTRMPLRKPSASLAKKIVEEATVFEEGTLPALTMGAAKQREAMRKLKELEEQANERVRRKAQRGVRINFDNEYMR